MSETRLVFGGMPTQFDVEKLERAFDGLAPGDMVTYADLEKTLDLEKTSNRFKTVVYAWQKKLYRERNLKFGVVMNQGYQVLTNSGRVSVSVKGFKYGLRRLARVGDLASRTSRDGLNEEEVRTVAHLENRVAFIRLNEATEARKLNMPDPEIKRLVGTH